MFFSSFLQHLYNYKKTQTRINSLRKRISTCFSLVKFNFVKIKSIEKETIKSPRVHKNTKKSLFPFNSALLETVLKFKVHTQQQQKTTKRDNSTSIKLARCVHACKFSCCVCVYQLREAGSVWAANQYKRPEKEFWSFGGAFNRGNWSTQLAQANNLARLATLAGAILITTNSQTSVLPLFCIVSAISS